MALKVFRSYITPDLDPEWGNATPPTNVEGYVVTVTPEDEDSYWFSMLLPECETDESAMEVITTAMALFLGDGDEYSVRGLTEEDVDKHLADSAPVMSFNPHTQDVDHIDFFWLVPPRNQMH